MRRLYLMYLHLGNAILTLEMSELTRRQPGSWWLAFSRFRSYFRLEHVSLHGYFWKDTKSHERSAWVKVA
jgi:hypothetical protein